MMKEFYSKIIPTPKYINYDKENKHTVIRGIVTNQAEWAPAVDAFCNYIDRAFNVSLRKNEDIEIALDNSLADGKYRIETADTVKIFARSLSGVNYALSTLWQLIYKKDGRLYAPCVSITDYPECNYRGLMVDLARQWHPFENLLFYADLCWALKINRLQLHFSDQQSYTLPSNEYPKLNRPYRFYAKEQIDRLNAYAAARSVSIVPEIDLPGHAKTIIDAYPQYFSNDITLSETIKADTAVCIGQRDIFKNLEKLIDEVIQLFPDSKLIHIGGDEVDHRIWEACPRCRDYMDKNGLTDSGALYTHVVKTLTDIVLKKGRTPVVWEGFDKSGAESISKEVIVMAWECYYNLPPDLIESGFNIVNCSWKPLYIVPEDKEIDGKKVMEWDEYDILKWNIYAWQNFWKESAAYVSPINISPTSQVLGGQLCAWEDDFNGEMRCIKTHLAALSERTWTVEHKMTDKELKTALKLFLPKINALMRYNKIREKLNEII